MSGIVDRYRRLEDPLRSERRVELVVVVLAGILIMQTIIGAAHMLVPSAPAPLPPAADAMRLGEVHGLEPLADDWREEIQSRPLFWSSRRAVAAPAGQEQAANDDAAEKKPGKIRDVKLTGVFGSGDSAGIIVTTKSGKRRLLVGEELNGWRLESVTPTKAVFRADESTAELELKQVAVRAHEEPQPAAEVRPTDGSRPDKEQARERRKQRSSASDSLKLGGGARNKR